MTNQLTVILTFVALLLVMVLIFFMVFVYRKDVPFKGRLIAPMFVGVIAVIDYSVFLWMNDATMAALTDAIYFVCTDWLAYYMMVYAFEYCRVRIPGAMPVIIMKILVFFDSIQLIVSAFTGHSFELAREVTENGYGWWSLKMHVPHYIHLAVCYVMVLSTLLALIVTTVRQPRYYKFKYSVVLSAYLVIIVANVICYSQNLPVDVSVYLYAILAAFISFCASIMLPHRLVNHLMQSVNSNVPDAIVCFDVNGHCIYCNQNAQELFTRGDEFSYDYIEHYRKEWLEKLGKPEDERIESDDTFLTKGAERYYDVQYQKLTNDGVVIGSFMVLRDRTSEIDSYLKERYLATHDPLTGIYNRERFIERSDELIAENPTSEYLLVYANIKDFKLINELFGEKVGDAVLVKEAELLRLSARPGSTYGRIGDDKFALMMKESNFDVRDFEMAIERIRKVTESSTYKIHFHVGLVPLKGTEESVRVACDKAQIAIDTISDDYQKVFVYYNDALLDRLMLEKDVLNRFDKALEQGEFQIFLQPQIDKEERMCGAEALVRWIDPEKGMLSPGIFIGVLERAGQIYRLDRFVWDAAAAQLRRWKDMGREDLYISVNVSARDFYYTDIYSTFTDLVKKYDIKPGNLKIEITESVLMDSFIKAAELVTKMQDAGFIIEIDDFGSGYSSLSMLKEIHANVLKVDMIFLRKTGNQERSQIIVGSVIGMAAKLGMEVVCEGVEDADQVEMLHEMNCDLIQGYYYSKPISVPNFEEKYKISK